LEHISAKNEAILTKSEQGRTGMGQARGEYCNIKPYSLSMLGLIVISVAKSVDGTEKKSVTRKSNHQ